MARPPEDSLDQNLTGFGLSKAPHERDSVSIGDQSTAGDAGQSLSDVGENDGAYDDLGDVVDLTARYEIQEVLGQGGMGEVCKALDLRLKRTVAIKRLRSEISHSRTGLRRFLTEAQAVAALNHFHIVQVYDYGRDKDGPFLILEYVDGPTLADVIDQKGHLEIEQAVKVTCQLCDALAAAHGRGIIHRDIKPANILLTVDGIAKLTDFGLARQESVDSGHTQAGALLGTIDFMPPEQRKDAALTDHRSDLWSLGATLYQMVTGRSPRVLRLDTVPDAIRNTIQIVLEEDPDARYSTALEFRDELRGAIRSSTESARGLSDNDPTDGQCAHCQAQNDISRRFCRSCGQSLREPCLGCEQQIGLWERFCPECGVDCHELKLQWITKIESIQQRVDAMRTATDFSGALALLSQLEEKQGHPSLQGHFDWLADVRAGLVVELNQAKQRCNQSLAEANQQFNAGNEKAALRVLTQISEQQRTTECSNLIRKCEERLGELKSLKQEIEHRIRSEDYDGLLVKVDRFLELRPNNKKLTKLRPRIVSRDSLAHCSPLPSQPAAAHSESIDAEGRSKCPSCCANVVLDPEFCGRSLECPNCKQMLQIATDFRELSIIASGQLSSSETSPHSVVEFESITSESDLDHNDPTGEKADETLTTSVADDSLFTVRIPARAFAIAASIYFSTFILGVWSAAGFLVAPIVARLYHKSNSPLYAWQLPLVGVFMSFGVFLSLHTAVAVRPLLDCFIVLVAIFSFSLSNASVNPDKGWRQIVGWTAAGTLGFGVLLSFFTSSTWDALVTSLLIDAIYAVVAGHLLGKMLHYFTQRISVFRMNAILIIVSTAIVVLLSLGVQFVHEPSDVHTSNSIYKTLYTRIPTTILADWRLLIACKLLSSQLRLLVIAILASSLGPMLLSRSTEPPSVQQTGVWSAIAGILFAVPYFLGVDADVLKHLGIQVGMPLSTSLIALFIAQNLFRHSSPATTSDYAKLAVVFGCGALAMSAVSYRASILQATPSQWRSKSSDDVSQSSQVTQQKSVPAIENEPASTRNAFTPVDEPEVRIPTSENGPLIRTSSSVSPNEIVASSLRHLREGPFAYTKKGGFSVQQFQGSSIYSIQIICETHPLANRTAMTQSGTRNFDRMIEVATADLVARIERTDGLILSIDKGKCIPSPGSSSNAELESLEFSLTDTGYLVLIRLSGTAGMFAHDLTVTSRFKNETQEFAIPAKE